MREVPFSLHHCRIGASPESFFLRRRNLAATAPFCYFTA